MEFSRQKILEYPPLGHLLNPGIEPVSPEYLALACGFFTTEPPGKPHVSSITLNEVVAEYILCMAMGMLTSTQSI